MQIITVVYKGKIIIILEKICAQEKINMGNRVNLLHMPPFLKIK